MPNRVLVEGWPSFGSSSWAWLTDFPSGSWFSFQSVSKPDFRHDFILDFCPQTWTPIAVHLTTNTGIVRQPVAEMHDGQPLRLKCRPSTVTHQQEIFSRIEIATRCNIRWNPLCNCEHFASLAFFGLDFSPQLQTIVVRAFIDFFRIMHAIDRRELTRL